MRSSTPKTRYARNGDARIAYQVIGDGPSDLIVVPGFVFNVEYLWEIPGVAAVLERFASYARLITWDKRGTGLSDPLLRLPPLEERMDDMLAVLDAAGSEQAALFGVSEGGPLSILFTATHPQRVSALVTYGAAPRMAWAPDYTWGIPPELYNDAAKEAVLDGWGDGVLLRAVRTVMRGRRADAGGLGDVPAASARVPSMGVATLMAMLEIDVRDILPSVRVPTLLIHRARDRAIPAKGSRFMSERIPNAKYVELEGEDHLWFVGDRRGTRRSRSFSPRSRNGVGASSESFVPDIIETIRGRGARRSPLARAVD